jgi:5-methylcytosine-specific restriction endonuclease McrA
MTEKSLPKLNTRAVLFVPICEGNHIAAAILEWIYIYSDLCERTRGVEPFEIYVESAMGNLCNPGPFAELGYEVDVDGNLETNLDNLRTLVSAQLSQPYDISDGEILEAINFLNTRRLAWIYDHSFCSDTKIEKLFNIPQLYSSFDKACVEWFTSKPQKMSSRTYLDRRREQKIITVQCSRARTVGQAATLTVEDWIETLEYFNGCCAFNPKHSYEVLEHFVPLSRGGGTTSFNCIPACAWCNAIKNDKPPTEITNDELLKAVPSIQQYLEKCKETWLRKREESNRK